MKMLWLFSSPPRDGGGVLSRARDAVGRTVAAIVLPRFFK
jgi:hypothetical protein